MIRQYIFSILEVYNYIENINREIIGRLDGENKPKLSDGTLVEDRKDFYFEKIYTFFPQSTSRDAKQLMGHLMVNLTDSCHDWKPN